jgi:hypothetical protein
MNRTTSHRELFGASAAMLLLSAPEAGAADPDARLLALCAECVDLEGVLYRLCLADTEHDPQHKAAEDAANARQQAVMLEIASIPARTTAGLAAKARAVRAFYELNPPEDGYAAGGMLWSLVLDAAGLTLA